MSDTRPKKPLICMHCMHVFNYSVQKITRLQSSAKMDFAKCGHSICSMYEPDSDIAQTSAVSPNASTFIVFGHTRSNSPQFKMYKPYSWCIYLYATWRRVALCLNFKHPAAFLGTSLRYIFKQ